MEEEERQKGPAKEYNKIYVFKSRFKYMMMQ